MILWITTKDIFCVSYKKCDIIFNLQYEQRFQMVLLHPFNLQVDSSKITSCDWILRLYKVYSYGFSW